MGFGVGGWGRHKKMALKGGSKEFKFCSDGICNNANSQPECQKTAFLTFKKVQIVSGKHTLGPPTLCIICILIPKSFISLLQFLRS